VFTGEGIATVRKNHHRHLDRYNTVVLHWSIPSANSFLGCGLNHSISLSDINEEHCGLSYVIQRCENCMACGWSCVSKLTDGITLLHSGTNAHVAHRVQDQQNIMLWEVLKHSALIATLLSHLWIIKVLSDNDM
jgi:hypothetical protein